MSEKIMKKSRGLIAALLGTVMIAALTIWGCGTSSYDDPSATTTKSSAVITAATLKGWIDEGKLNSPYGSRDRVVVVSPSTTIDWTGKGHIPGAVRLDTSTEVANSRIEGLALATNMMPTGAMMDAIVQRLGIDGNTTIVISLPKNSTIYYQSLVFWNFRYWGFARDRIKILNGGDDAWDVAGYSLSTDATEKYTASIYSVAQNGTLKDVVRYSLGEMITTTDALINTPTLEETWQILDVRGATITPYITNAQRLVLQPGHAASYTMYLSRLNGDSTRNFVYPDKATFETRLATLAVKDGISDVYASAIKKTVVMCASSFSASPTFVLFDAVIGAAEGDIMMYDGSSSQWNVYSAARLSAKYPAATPAQISAWAFDNLAAPIRAQGILPASTDLSIWSATAPVLGPTHLDMNQIENADKAYLTPAIPTTTTGGGASSSVPPC
ncbi:MAG: hypothetical protein J0665_06315 [Deltaproteobacteria bacterium]|nr:hypothetical protein [Deltaproteobacteria bacterium]